MIQRNQFITLLANNDHYYLIDSLANTNANIFAVDSNCMSARQVSNHTLIVLTTIIKIELKTIVNNIWKRKLNFIKKYSKSNKNKKK